MAIVPMQKISLFVYKNDKPKVVEFLQSKGVLHVMDTPAEEGKLQKMEQDEEGRVLEFNVAQLEFAVNFLKKFEQKKKGLQAMIDGDAVQTNANEVQEVVEKFEFKEVVERCQSVEEELISLHNEEKSIKATEKQLEPWKSLGHTLDFPRETKHITSFFISLPLKDWAVFRANLFRISSLIVLDCENIHNNRAYAQIITDREFITDINSLLASYKAERIDLPVIKGTVTDELERLDGRLKKIEERNGQLQKAANELAKDLPNLRMTYDYYNWKWQQRQIRQNFAATKDTILISGWMPKVGIKKIQDDLNNISKYFVLLEVEPDKGEVAPVLMRNTPFLRPFRAVTDVYGLPLYHELDPTPYLAVFFIVYFGMCLTDAGYGILMFALMWMALRYLRIPQSMQNLVRLLMYGGILTFVMGILFGGWFSLTPDQAPDWMVRMNADGEPVAFIGQRFNALENAMQVLILSLGLGFIQTLFGVWLNFIHNFRNISKKDALLDSLPWAYLLTVIGVFILVAAGVLPEGIKMIVQYLLYIGIAIIIFTQGRKKSNIIAKFFSGILSLYDLVGYMSDILSYSRLLALGLATAIIGMAVNTIAGLAGGIPYVGIVFAIIVLIVGHVFNLGINALGSFIHSGRLQFVEFFGKFLEGGGAPFQPLKRDSRFVQFDK